MLHNPFPQLKRIAVLPFYNQSNEPTLNSDLVAEKYYTALQAIPGFEVLPLGVARAQLAQYSIQYGEPSNGFDFQQLAKQMGVEAIVVGSVTDYRSFYPPRMAMTVHWYAANDGFHPIPAGYGLPWGTDQEKQIPRRIAREAEFELARSQLATQTPVPAGASVNPGAQPFGAQPAPSASPTPLSPPPINDSVDGQLAAPLQRAIGQVALQDPSDPFYESESVAVVGSPWDQNGQEIPFYADEIEAPLPAEWPDPTDLIPDPPSPVAPIAQVSREPVLAHTRLYQGDDPYFTGRLADYVETGDDARSSGWQGYLRRSDDFVRFCCHLHVTEMLESRGGKEQSEFILRWPLSRY